MRGDGSSLTLKVLEHYRYAQPVLTEQRGPRSLDDESGPWSAWRVWSIIDVDGELRLGSPFFPSRRYWWKRAREVWPVGEPMGELLEPGEAGDPSITGAGVYAGVTKRSVSNFADKYLFDARELGATGGLYVIGTVALWGRRLPGRPGTPELRFEFGYPIELGGIEDMRDVREPSPDVLREPLRDLYRLNDGSGLHDAVAASADQLRTHLSTRYCEDAGGWAHLSGTDARDVASCSAGDGYVDMDALVAALERDSTGGSSHLHGWAHWRQVAAFAMTLARNTPGADPLVALLFGLLHDSQRWSDGYDPAHGERAAELARALNGGPFELSVPQMRRLTFALEEHAEGLLSAEPTIGVCWDADRLALWRLYRRPAASLLSTEAARERSDGHAIRGSSLAQDAAELAHRRRVPRVSQFRFSTDIRVRFAETDAQGVAHNSNYLVWFEIARIAYLEEYAGGYPALRETGLESFVLESHIRYRLPAHFDDRLRIHARVGELRGARFRFDYEVRRNGEVIADGWTAHACVDAKTLRPTRIPSVLADALAKAES